MNLLCIFWGLLFCVSPSSLVPCPPNVRCPSNRGLWSLLVLPSEIAPFCLGSSSPCCPQTQCGPHLMCCTISKITALHCLPSTWKQLVRILPSLVFNHNGNVNLMLVTPQWLELEVTSTCLLTSEPLSQISGSQTWECLRTRSWRLSFSELLKLGRGAQVVAFLMNSQVIPMLFIQRPYFEELLD